MSSTETKEPEIGNEMRSPLRSIRSITSEVRPSGARPSIVLAPGLADFSFGDIKESDSESGESVQHEIHVPRTRTRAAQYIAKPNFDTDP